MGGLIFIWTILAWNYEMNFMIRKHVGMVVLSLFTHITWLWVCIMTVVQIDQHLRKKIFKKMIDQNLGILYEILDCQLKKSNLGDELKESVIALERRHTKQVKRIHSYPGNLWLISFIDWNTVLKFKFKFQHSRV